MGDVEKISEPIGVQPAEVLEWSKSLRDRSPSPVGNKTKTRSRSRSPSAGQRLVNSARKPSPNSGRKMSPSNSARKPSPSNSARRLSPSRSKGMLKSNTVAVVQSSGTKTRTSRKEAFSGTIPSSTSVLMMDLKPTTSKAPKMSQSSKTASNLRKSDSSLRRSAGNSTSKSLAINGSTEGIEAEYIKNLQQQIYFLELETNYLREQAKKATDMHPKMSAEAERMLAKLRSMQADMDGLQMENRRKESSIGIVTREKDHMAEKLREEEEARARDKRLLMDEIIELKKSIAKLESELSFKNGQLIDARNELDKSGIGLKNAETKIVTLKGQLESRIEQHKMTQISLEEKRSELLSVETQLKTTEEKYYNSTVNLQDRVVSELREEIRDLRQKLKEAEMTAEQERHLRTKMSDDSSSVVRENATLHQQVMEITRQLEREKNLRDEIEARHQSNIGEMVQGKDREKELRHELEYLKDQLVREGDKLKQYQEQITMKESVSTHQELQLNTAKSRVTELTGMHEHMERENGQLRKDKSLLVDHVAELQRKLETKTEEVVNLKSHVMSLEQRLDELEQNSSLQATSQTQKWSEFEKLAESMRTLSHTMASTSSGGTSARSRSQRNVLTGSLTSSSRPMQF